MFVVKDARGDSSKAGGVGSQTGGHATKYGI